MAAGRRATGGLPQLSTAQQAMLDREMWKTEGKEGRVSGVSGARPTQLSTAQQAMLNSEKQGREALEAGTAAEANAGADDTVEEQQQDGEPVEALEDVDAGVLAVLLPDVFILPVHPLARDSLSWLSHCME